MTYKTIFTTLSACCCTAIMAQQPTVVTDMETGVPVRDVQIFVNGDESKRMVTDYKGEFNIPDTAHTLTLCHPKYEKRTMESKEFADTVSLLPNSRRLNELVVVGHTRKVNMNIISSAKEAAMAVPQQKPLATFDFFNLFTYKKRKKTRERIEAIKDY